MARKAFIADVAAECNKSIPNIRDVHIGDGGEELVFTFTTCSGQQLLIRALATDVSAYPKDNTYFLSTESLATAAVTKTLECLQGSLAGLTIHDLLIKSASALRSVATGSQTDPLTIDEEGDGVLMDEKNDEDIDGENDGDDEDGEYDEWYPSSLCSDGSSTPTRRKLNPSVARTLNRRIVQDLRRVKWAGFRIGILAGMKAESTSSILSISIQVVQLGLSEEALQAWDLERHQYIILLIRYLGPYTTFQAVMGTPVRQLQIDFRLGVSNRYKPSLQEALAAFSTAQNHATENSETVLNPTEDRDNLSAARFRGLFISSPMNQLMNDQFFNLLKIRKTFGCGWEGAKHIYNQQQSRADMLSQEPPNLAGVDMPTKKDLPPLITADHLNDAEDENHSLPLIAMQFVMLYLLRCTEFCLVCHKNTEGSFEALKPYVCSDPLCLYQYMSLGFGPSIEHEILTQPYVVDLLISFCYASACSRRLREYPTGMGLTVPLHFSDGSVPPAVSGPSTIPSTDSPEKKDQIQGHHDVSFNCAEKEITMGADDNCNIRPGDWVQITTLGVDRQSFHSRVTSYTHPLMTLANSGLPEGIVSSLSNISVNSTRISTVSEVSNNGQASLSNPTNTPAYRGSVPAKLTIYDRKFDDLDENCKSEAIIALLSNIPSVKEMRTYLWTRKASSEPLLRDWVDRLCPAALGLLRWIVASNRSCIVQVDKYPGQLEADVLLNNSRLGQKVTNLEGWVQFRFAQGAPDKEQRFHQALTSKHDSINKAYPTLFAWHGSAVQNWHSIIRTGLDFKETLNGRAFGNGCYHSQNFVTSLAYCNISRMGYLGSQPGYWSNSDLKIVNAICLNEIVNAPNEFISLNPHLVVQHVDWIQCRYLFVQCGRKPDGDSIGVPPISSEATRTSAFDSTTIEYIKQDPTMEVKGNNGQRLGIPRSALPASRAFCIEGKTGKTQNKRQKKKSPAKDKLSSYEIEVISDDSDIEDITFLISDDESQPTAESGVKGIGCAKNSVPLTDFIPGTLDRSTIKLLGSPSYATSAATNTLSRDLKTLLKVQSAAPLHELGWYIDGDAINNIYQWIIEFHSFESTLPLAVDMKSADISSVVLEMRFGKSYPMSPPFVRVIRPRFLPFMSGGGGNVTAGGAMCMELLTNSGWSAASSIESVLLQVRMAISSTDPNPARLESRDKAYQNDYGVGEAIEAYLRACRAHGWEASDMGDFR